MSVGVSPVTRVGSGHPAVGVGVGATWLCEQAERTKASTATSTSLRDISPYAEAVRDKRGNGERDWGNIDWSNLDLSVFRSRRGNVRRPPASRGVVITIVILLLLLVPVLLLPLNEFLTDLLWFRSLGLEDVYLRRYTAGFWAFVAFFLIFVVIALPNLYLALRPQVPR
ncbi:MAG: hypothetical protein E6J35_13080, partial [Chloroflexi bacterium]